MYLTMMKMPITIPTNMDDWRMYLGLLSFIGEHGFEKGMPIGDFITCDDYVFLNPEAMLEVREMLARDVAKNLNLYARFGFKPESKVEWYQKYGTGDSPLDLISTLGWKTYIQWHVLVRDRVEYR